MVEHKGFKIPSTVDEVRDMLLLNRSGSMAPTFSVRNGNGTMINVPISIEQIFSGEIDMSDVVKSVSDVIDQFTESAAD